MNTSHIAENLQPLAVPIQKLVPDPANARNHGKHSIDGIKKSLRAFGQQKVIVCVPHGEDDYFIVAGNGTYEAALELEWDCLAVSLFEGSKEEAMRYAIADNRTAELSEWDTEALARVLESIPEEHREETGWTHEEIAVLLQQYDTDPDDFDTPIEPISDAELQNAIKQNRTLSLEPLHAVAWDSLMRRLMDGFSVRETDAVAAICHIMAGVTDDRIEEALSELERSRIAGDAAGEAAERE